MKRATIAKLMMAALAYRPPPLLPGSDWADTYRVLPSTDAEPGPYRTDRFPLVREVQDVLCDDSTRTIIIWGPTQAAKTTAVNTMIGRAIHHDPGRMLIVYPTEDKAKEFSIEKLEPMLGACPVLTEKAELGAAWTTRKAILDKTFPGMSIYIRGGNTENAYSSGSMRYVFLDELDRIPRNKEGKPADLARQRVTTFANHKVVLASTCTDDGSSEIAAEYGKSDQRKPYVPCMACGHMHKMGFYPPGSHGYEDGDGWVDFDGEQDKDLAATRARYRCPACLHEHYDRDKPAMLARVEWRKGDPQSKVAGFWWSALYSPWVSFGQLAYEFRASNEDDDAFKTFTNCKLAKLWKVKTDAPAASVLEGCIDRERGRGVVPSEALILTGGADVQKHVVYWVVRAWGANGRSWLVNHGVVERDGGRLDALDDAFAVPYGNHIISLALIDSGWDEEAVYDYCLARRNCQPSKGMPGDVLYDVEASEQKRERGQYRGHAFRLWKVNSHKLRGHLHDRIPLGIDDPRAWRLHNEVEGEYKRHILARERFMRKLQSRLVMDWNNPDKPDHYMDAEIYAFAASKTPMIAPILVAGRLPVRRTESGAAAIRGEPRGRGPIRRSYG